ncbi:MAG: ABC transporter ATP-binding protein [Candidatus Taylorbacteria bacterium]|nr:ABC transporter ATP-binding protein [Candidatus Taylorbacteria bacterium]
MNKNVSNVSNVSNGSHSVVRNIVKVFSLGFKAAPVNMFLLVLVSLIMGAWTILGAKAFSLFIDAIVGFIKSGSSSEVWYTLFLYIAIIITPNFLDIAHRFLDWKFYLRFQTYVEFFILGKRANFDVAHYESSEFLDKLRHAFNQGTSPLKNISDRMIWVFRYGATAVVGSLAVLLIDWRVFCIIFILAIPQFIVELKANKTLWNISMSNSKEKRVYDHLNGFFFNRFSFIGAKLFGIHWNFIGRIKKLLTDFNEQQIPVEKKRALISIATEALSAVGIFAGMALIVQKALSGEVNVGSIVFVFSAASSAKDQMGNLFMQISRISSDSLYTEDIFKVIDTEPVVKESKTAKEISLDSAPIIEFRGVSFKYPGTEEFAVRDISFIMQPGDKIGLVGHNGSGKSTLVRLLLRFHDPTEGQILINGMDLREIKRDSWWEGLGVLLQDFSNFVSLSRRLWL